VSRPTRRAPDKRWCAPCTGFHQHLKADTVKKKSSALRHLSPVTLAVGRTMLSYGNNLMKHYFSQMIVYSLFPGLLFGLVWVVYNPLMGLLAGIVFGVLYSLLLVKINRPALIKLAIPSAQENLKGPRAHNEYRPSSVESIQSVIGIFASMAGSGFLAAFYNTRRPLWLMVIYLVLMCLTCVFFLKKRLVITCNGLEYKNLLYKIIVSWKDLQYLEKYPSGREQLVFRESDLVASKYMASILRLTESERKIPLSLFSNEWRKSELGKDIQQFVP
jgi:hypothetical protein